MRSIKIVVGFFLAYALFKGMLTFPGERISALANSPAERSVQLPGQPSHPPQAQSDKTTLMQRSRAGQPELATKDDPDLARARQEAQASFDRFLNKVDKPPAGAVYWTVKVKITDGLNDEHIWVKDFARTHDGFSGRVDNTPGVVDTVKSGQTIRFARHAISDWMFVDGDGMHGNFSGCVLIKRAPAAEAQDMIKKFRMKCDSI